MNVTKMKKLMPFPAMFHYKHVIIFSSQANETKHYFMIIVTQMKEYKNPSENHKSL